MKLFQNEISRKSEFVYYFIFIFIVFLFYSFDRNNPEIEIYEIVFFLNYTIAALIISYFLFPKYIYQNKLGLFIVYFVLLLGVVILIEELVIEQIYFPDTRGNKFSNIFYTLIDVSPPIIILSGFKLAWDAVSKQRQLDELKLMIKESELQFLKNQINPHFLFNNLNNLYVHAVEKSSKTPDIILALSSLLRYMLYECKVAYVPLNKEIEQLQNFINLGELQIEGRGSVVFKKNIQPNSYSIAPLILVNFIENAFKHSSSSTMEDILIDIEIKVSPENILLFNCKNTFQKETNTDTLTQGIGLNNVRKRLDLIYPNSYKLSIDTIDNKYSVQLELQLNNKTT